ncbi:MerR family transcriptional regulator [Inquilinus sp. CA228]|uniref:MerR family transcriptional regulator n=1 Tax=Inquilinus sp. CA228 TaxID=3455609 RepID=UPI003F8D6C61
MLISEFARATRLPVDTVRFYVRRGLLAPETNGKGGRNPYQIFTAEHVREARLIRMAQSLGMSLKEIAAIGQENRRGGITRERSIELMAEQLARVERKAAELAAMAGYLRAKLAWLKGGEQGLEPDFSAYSDRGPGGACG